jgi:hypothetical protein
VSSLFQAYAGPTHTLSLPTKATPFRGAASGGIRQITRPPPPTGCDLAVPNGAERTTNVADMSFIETAGGVRR